MDHWPLVALAALLAAPGCGTEYMSRSEMVYGFPTPPPSCDGDQVCEQVNAHLDGIRSTIGDWCGTPRMGYLRDLVAMGEPAVPTLLRALDADGWVHPHYAARALTRMNHAADVAAWCRANTAHENFPWACQEHSPFTLWPWLVDL